MKRYLKRLAETVLGLGKRHTTTVRQARPQMEALEERQALSGARAFFHPPPLPPVSPPPIVDNIFYLTKGVTNVIDTLQIRTESRAANPLDWNFTAVYTDTTHHVAVPVSGTATSISLTTPGTPKWDLSFNGTTSGFARESVSFWGEISVGLGGGPGTDWIRGTLTTTQLYGSIVVPTGQYGLYGWDSAPIN